MIRFYCLFRSRMAKHEVITRLLERNISDGEWHRGDCEEPVFLAKRNLALAVIRKCRQRYMNAVKSKKEAMVKPALYPELKVAYDEVLNGHFIQFPDLDGCIFNQQNQKSVTSIYHNILGTKPIPLRKFQTA